MGKLILNGLLLSTGVLMSFLANGQNVGQAPANNVAKERHVIVYTSPELQIISNGDRSNANLVVYTSPDLQVVTAQGTKSNKKGKNKKELVVFTSPELQIKKD